jgi:hypothetical protein
MIEIKLMANTEMNKIIVMKRWGNDSLDKVKGEEVDDNEDDYIICIITEKETNFMMIVIMKKTHDSFWTLKTFNGVSGCRSLQHRGTLWYCKLITRHPLPAVLRKHISRK